MHWIDPDSLSPIASKVERFLFNPKGDADGMLLANGTEAHFPPHMSKPVLERIQCGDKVTVYGVKPKAADMLALVAIETEDGERICDDGPPDKHHGHPHPKHPKKKAASKEVEVEGNVDRLLHGPKGEVRGLLLSGGQIVRFPPHALERAQDWLAVGESVAVRGRAIEVGETQVLEAEAWGPSGKRLKALEPKRHV